MERTKLDDRGCSHTIGHRASESVGEGPVFESKDKIFLSHSGAQKEFVRHLYKALEDCGYYPFFDGRHESLSKGKGFPNILEAIQQCQLFVVVVSEEYFMSKWPVIQLNAFVQASKVLKSNANVAILPLFYGLSENELKDKKRQQRWLREWKTLAHVDGRIKVEDWCYALNELTKFNGLSYDRELKDIVAYENEIVSLICALVPPDVKWQHLHVQGNAHEVLIDKMKQIGLSQMYKMKVVGIHGIAGIGKTTTSKILCSRLSSLYGGRVCHVEFDNACSNFEELLQNAVINLTKQSEDFVHELGEEECKDILKKNLCKQRTLLVVDNVLNNDNSIKQAQMFLETPSHEDSLVIVTTRSQSTLARLGIYGDACLEMPELRQVDATSFFLYYADLKEKFTRRWDMDSIELCIRKCYFCKSDGQGYYYHPLALEALGRQLHGFQGKPSKWVQRLSRVWKPWSFLGKDCIFNVLRSSFDLLQPIEQTLFMDIGFFLSPPLGDDFKFRRHWMSWKEKLCLVYMMGELEIQSQLDSLKQKGLLQDADLTSGRITMHDLYCEFATLEVVLKFGTTRDIWDRRWVLVDGDDGDLSELEVTPSGGCWQKLSRLSIYSEKGARGDHFQLGFQPLSNLITSLNGIKWKYFSNVLVLQLYGSRSIHGSLNLTGMKCLRSLKLCNFLCLEKLEGLESLKHLTCLDWEILDSSTRVTSKTHVVGQVPASLRYLSIVGQCILSGSSVLAHCNNLIKLRLLNVEVGVLLDLSNCSSLEGLEISGIKDLQTLSGLTSTMSFGQHNLEICRWDSYSRA